ncbi:hypothetical protein P792_13370 [Asaia sp. SF2.1]|nr:hypothetical protein P792_13370 [Asaia sp. SF2.1]
MANRVRPRAADRPGTGIWAIASNLHAARRSRYMTRLFVRIFTLYQDGFRIGRVVSCLFVPRQSWLLMSGG